MRGVDVQRKGLGRTPRGLALSGGTSSSAVRSRLRSKEVTDRKQVGDVESMMNEEQYRYGDSFSDPK